MKANENFHMRVSPVDRATFAEIARRLNRTQSDAIRIIAREFLRVMQDADSIPNQIITNEGENVSHKTT